MIFEVYSIPAATQAIVNGVTQTTHCPIEIVGKGKYVQFHFDSNNTIAGDDRLTTDYNPYISDNSLKAVFNFIDLPSEIYLADGETLYLSTLQTSNRIVVTALHYDKGEVTSAPTFTGFTGTIDVTPK